MQKIEGLEAKNMELVESSNEMIQKLGASEKNIEYLKVNEAKLEQELEHSEHLRLHHEGESQSEATRANEIEAELKQLREDIVKANMALNDVSSRYDMAQDLVEEKNVEVEDLKKLNEALEFRLKDKTVIYDLSLIHI